MAGVMGFGSPAPAQQPSIYDRLMGGLLGTSNYGGMLTPEEQKAAQQRGLLAMGAQLMAAGGPSDQRVSFGQALGPAIMAGQQAQQQAGNNMLEAMLLKTKLQPKKSKLQDEYEYAKSQGFKGSVEDWRKVASIEAKDPASIQEYNLAKSQGYEGPFEQWIRDRAQATVTMPFVPMTVAGVPGFGNRQSGGFTPTSTLPGEANAAATLKEAEARAAELAKAQAGRDATFQEDVNVIDDEILRTQRLLSEFKSGKYQTGPLSGRMPNMRTAAQDLEREQGKDTIKAISSATFGALSEGERGFLKDLGVSQTANEESNINMLERRLEELQRTKRRLSTRERLGVGPSAAPSATPSGASRPPLSSFQK